MKLAVVIFILVAPLVAAQSPTNLPTYAERLGWPAGTRALIMHVDDAGMSWESNAGAIGAIRDGRG